MRLSMITFALIFGILLPGCDKRDSCLDLGGCWDSTGKVCRKDEPNAQQLCDRTKAK